MVRLGLSWWQTWLCVWTGYYTVAPFVVANARPGAYNLSHRIPGGRSQPLKRLQQRPRGNSMVGHIEAFFVDRRLTALVAFGMCPG